MKVITESVLEYCPKCHNPSDPEYWVRLKWVTNAGKERNTLVCTRCYDRTIELRERTARREARALS